MNIEHIPGHLMRQADLIPLSALGEKINVIGAGAIGSWVVLALAKMGISDITVYDHDEISIENMNCQFYPRKDIGRPKVEALKEMVELFTGVQIEAINGKYEGGPLPGIVISAVDNMEVRKNIWKNQREIPIAKYVIDPRMGAESALMYCMRPNDDKDAATYEKTFYGDADAVQERCTAKATIYTANLLSGLVAKTVKDLVTDGKYPRSVQWSIKDNAFQAWSNQ